MDLAILMLAVPLLAATAAVLWPRRPVPVPHAGPATPVAQSLGIRARAEVAEFLGRLWPWLAVILIVVGLVLVLSQLPDALNFFRLTLLTRYSLLTGALLVGLTPLALAGFPSLLGSLFTLRRPLQLFNATWASLLVATMAVVTSRVAEMNACERYGLATISGNDLGWEVLRAADVLLLGLPVPFACLVCSLRADPRASRGLWIGFGFVAGALAGIALIIASLAIQDIFLDEKVQDVNLFPYLKQLSALRQALGLGTVDTRWLVGGVAWLSGFLDHRGYVQTNDPSILAKGHAQVIAASAVGLLFYLAGYLTVRLPNRDPDQMHAFPPLFYLLLVLLLIGFVLQGIAFALDLQRVPVLLAVVLFSFVLYQFNRTDHYFDLDPPAEEERPPAPKVAGQPAAPAAPAAPVAPPTLDEVARNWRLPTTSKGEDGQTGKKTLVVVTASGGGIQASAWISRVLVGLHQRYRDDFTRSIGLISAVSGGSVGVMYFLDQWQNVNPTFPAGALAFTPARLPAPGSICHWAMASSLDATAWGIAFPDLLRVVFPPVVPRTDDRGARIEDAWRRGLVHRDIRLTDWSARIRQGLMPIPVFNSTIVETGQRLLSSPVLARRPGDPPPDASQARELLHLYPGARPRLSTAVRLSATFPFVSPICRALQQPGWPSSDAYHFCDGGYVDNEGMVTVIDWLRRLILDDTGYFPVADRLRAFDQVLLIRLMPFPSPAGPALAQEGKGWVYSTIGPIEALQNVRGASQIERNHLAVELFTQAAAQRGVRVGAATFTFESAPGASPPLSWMLTEAQKQDVERAWQQILDGRHPNDPLGVVDQFFNRAERP